MCASRADRQVARAYRSDFLELRGIFPDLDKFLLAHVAAGQRKLHAWIDVAVRRDVAGAMSRAARNVVHVVVVGAWSDRDELVLGLAGDTLVVHYVTQVFARDVQREQ